MQDETNADSLLTSELCAVAGADAAEGASGHVRARLLTEVRAIGRARRRRQVTAALALAAAVLLAVVISWPRSAPSVPNTAVARVDQPVREYATPFLSLSYGGIPGPNAQIVRMRFPRTALRSFGLLSFDAGDAASSEMVWADLVIDENGIARAVRFIRSAIEPRSYHAELKSRP
jgi:hypothetical protein